MIRFQILVSTFLVGCATTHDVNENERCETPCGAFTFEGNCKNLQSFEGHVVRDLSSVVAAWPAEKICAALRGWEIRTHPHRKEDMLCPDRAWQHAPGVCVWGFTWDNRRLIE